MKNIIAFKVFNHEEHDYCETIDNNKNYYNLILFDEDSNEYWFDTGCGYKGMSSFYNEKILRLVGIREDYNIALDALQIFGAVRPSDNAIGGDLYVKYFDNYDSEDKFCRNYGINNILFLDSYLNKDIKLNISNNIKDLLGSNSNISIKEIKKTEYGTCTYL